MSNVEFVLDTRERELITHLQDMSPLVEQLPIGDILYRKDGETILVIERKTIADLKASIQDGRAREQKARLLGTTPRNRIMYLVEGDVHKPFGSLLRGIPVSTLVGSMINTQFRDGIAVYKTTCIDETANFLRKLTEKLNTDLDEYFKAPDEISAGKYASTLKKPKKENMTPQVWFIAQLSLIPRVTEDVAECILDEYESMNNLIAEYESIPEELRYGLLADLTYTTKKTGNTHRIGAKMSGCIYKFLYGISD